MIIDPIATVKKIVQLAKLIDKAMTAVQQNAKACGDINRMVTNVGNITTGLENNTEAMKDRATRDALDHLEKMLHRALKLVQECQKKQRLVPRLVAAPDLSKQLREVKEDISQNVNVLNLALSSLAHDHRAKQAGGGLLALLPLHRQQQTVIKPLQRQQQTVIKPLQRPQQTVIKPLQRQQQTVIKPLQRQQQTVIKPLQRQQQTVIKPLQRQQQTPPLRSFTVRSSMTPAPNNGTRMSKTPAAQGYGTSAPRKAVAPVRKWS